jgi:8-oxo-dGTP diphosphatase
MRVSDIEWNTWKAKDPATLIFVVKNGSILLIRKKRGLGAGKINGPGGRLEPGESPHDCAIREAREELHITPLGVRFAGENRFQFVDGYSIHAHVFKATDLEGEPTETEEATPLWTPLTSIPYEEMWEDDRLWLPLVLEDVRFSGRYVFDGDAMLDHELMTLPHCGNDFGALSM